MGLKSMAIGETKKRMTLSELVLKLQALCHSGYSLYNVEFSSPNNSFKDIGKVIIDKNEKTAKIELV